MSRLVTEHEAMRLACQERLALEVNEYAEGVSSEDISAHDIYSHGKCLGKKCMAFTPYTSVRGELFYCAKLGKPE